MRVLVTRPEEDARHLVKRLEAAGHKSIAAPLLDIIFEDIKSINLEQVQAVLLTSANGARALARLTDARAIPVLAVGDATARAARALGFEDVRTAGGDVEALAALAADALDPAAGALLHVAGKQVAGDLKAELEAIGFEVQRTVAYRADAVNVLPAAARAALAAEKVDCALFYSPRTARIFAGLAATAGLENSLGTVTAGCLSPAVRDALQSLPWQRIVVAKTPDEDALLAATGLNSPAITID